MKYLVLIGDGMADLPLEEHGGRTPLELAATPAMDEVVRLGLLGLFWPIPMGSPPGSDIGNLSLFGYNPRETFPGRAPLEAANMGISLREDQVAFRCNLVTLCNGIMENFTSGHISTEEAARLIDALNEVNTDLPAVFHAGVSYRHLAIVTPRDTSAADVANVACTPPHDIIGKPYDRYLPKGPGSALLRELTDFSRPILEGNPVNRARVAAGKPPATSIWLWGQGRSPSMAPYVERFGLTGAVISAVDLVNGIGLCAGLEVIKVPGATGYLDTNYAGKVHAATRGLSRVDFVYLHVEAPDEASHEGRTDLKIQAIEAFDRKVVAPCLEHVRSRGDVRLLVAPDHATTLSTRTHAGGSVPFALCGAAVEPDTAAIFSEREAAKTGVEVREGHKLVPYILRSATVTSQTLKCLNR